MLAAKKFSEPFIHEEIRAHQAWYGSISGLVAEKMLRDRKTPYLFMLREGEKRTEFEADYYVTFLSSDLTVKHQPFVVTVTLAGWEWENGCPGGAPPEASIDYALPFIMHCKKSQPIPLYNLGLSGK